MTIGMIVGDVMESRFGENGSLHHFPRMHDTSVQTPYMANVDAVDLLFMSMQTMTNFLWSTYKINGFISLYTSSGDLICLSLYSICLIPEKALGWQCWRSMFLVWWAPLFQTTLAVGGLYLLILFLLKKIRFIFPKGVKTSKSLWHFV